MMTECIFCDILAGNSPGSFVFRDEICTVFLDIQPVNPGHLLISPNQHYSDLASMPPEIGGHLFSIAQKMAGGIYNSQIRSEGVNLFLADGEAAGQEIFHVHLHLIPRFRGDGSGKIFDPSYSDLSPRDELDRIAALVRQNIKTEEPSRSSDKQV